MSTEPREKYEPTSQHLWGLCKAPRMIPTREVTSHGASPEKLPGKEGKSQALEVRVGLAQAGPRAVSPPGSIVPGQKKLQLEELKEETCF